MSNDPLNLSNELDYFVKTIYYTLTLPRPLTYIQFEITFPPVVGHVDAVLKTNGNGDLFWESENDQHFCERCNSKLEYIETYISIFSENKEKILKCKNCGWC